MAVVSRRQVLLSSGALFGACMIPGTNLIRNAISEEFTKPDYMIRMGTNENPWGPSRVALRAIVDSIKDSSLYGGNRRRLAALAFTGVGPHRPTSPKLYHQLLLRVHHLDFHKQLLIQQCRHRA